MAYRVTFSPSGNTVEISEGKNILNCALEAKIALPYSCKTGVCRTCRGRVVSGQIEHGMVHPHYLSEEEKAQGFAHLCQAKPLSDLTIEVEELTGLSGIETRQLPGRVVKLERLADDVMLVQIRLQPNDNMRYLAGQYLAVKLPDGEVRNYSIAVAPSTEAGMHLDLHIRLMPGGRYTEHVFGEMKLRDLMRFDVPLGTFYIREESQKPIVMVASGTGFAPIKAMCEYAFDRGMLTSRPIKLYWGCRTKKDLYMLETAESWAEQHDNFEFIPVLSEPTPECDWGGRTAFVHEAVMQDIPDMSGVQMYVAGNPAMVDAARQAFTESCDLPASEFFADSFLSERDKLPNKIA